MRMMQKRNVSIELFRALLMLGIVMLHVINQGGYCKRGYWDAFRPCVVGFVFISGFFGMRFDVRKALKLAFTGIWCAFVSVGLECVLKGTGRWVADVLYAIPHSYWFLWAYLVLMCFAPLIDAALEMKGGKSLCGVLFVVFAWSFLAIVPGVKNYIPAPAGFGDMTPLALIGIYAAGRLCRVLNLHEKISTKWIVAGLAVCFVGVACGLGQYNSPIALAFMGLLFVAFYRLRLSDWCGSALAFITPSLLPVYLLHQTARGWNPIGPWMSSSVNAGVPVQISWVLVAMGVFVCAFVLDLVFRRFVWFCFTKFARIKK